MNKKHILISLILSILIIITIMPKNVNAKIDEEDILEVNHDISKQDIDLNQNCHIGITIVDETTDLSTKINIGNEDNATDEDFFYENKQWAGIPSVITAGNNLFVAWYTGGPKEPDNNNYICIALSPDKGKTWINPWMIITGNPRGLGWPLFFYNAQDELCLSYADNKMAGCEMIKFVNPDGDVKDIRYTRPIAIGPTQSIFCKPTLLSNGSLMTFYGAEEAICSINKDGTGELFKNTCTLKSSVDITNRKFSEMSVVEKDDGTLWALRRLENALGLEQYFSKDYGKTWTKGTCDLPNPPFYSPGSRFSMIRLHSGALVFVTNIQGRNTDRRNMTIYMSTDDGETWPYSLQLDPTQTSYPDLYQDEDDNIYCAFDRERYGEAGIRLCVFTEEDIIAGSFISENHIRLLSLTKRDNEYGDIASLNGAFEKEMKFPTGIEIKELLKNFDKHITVTDDNGKTYELDGIYKVSNYDKDVPGAYKAYFVPDEDLPRKLKDGFNMLSFTIILEDTNTNDTNGCKSNISLSFLQSILFFIPILILNDTRRRNYEEII